MRTMRIGVFVAGLVAAALLATPAPASAQFSVGTIAACYEDNPAGGTTFACGGGALTFTAGRHACVGVTIYSPSAESVTGVATAADTFTLVDSFDTGSIESSLWCKTSLTGGSSQTVTVTANLTMQFAHIGIAEFASIGGGVTVEDFEHASGAGGATTAALTTTHTNSVFIGFARGSAFGPTWTEESMYTKPAGGMDSPNAVAMIEYRTFTSAQASRTISVTSSDGGTVFLLGVALADNSSGGASASTGGALTLIGMGR